MKNLTELLAVHFAENKIYFGKNILNQSQILIFLKNLISKLTEDKIIKNSGFTLSKKNGKTRIEYKDKLITLVEYVDEIPFAEEITDDEDLENDLF